MWEFEQNFSLIHCSQPHSAVQVYFKSQCPKLKECCHPRTLFQTYTLSQLKTEFSSNHTILLFTLQKIRMAFTSLIELTFVPISVLSN